MACYLNGAPFVKGDSRVVHHNDTISFEGGQFMLCAQIPTEGAKQMVKMKRGEQVEAADKKKALAAGGDDAAAAGFAVKFVAIVHVKSARGLAKADLFGKSDPFAVLKMNGKRVAKTEVIWKTLDPTWEKGHFKVEFPTAAVASSDLRLEVYDKDIIGSDDFLGQIILDETVLGEAKEWVDEEEGDGEEEKEDGEEDGSDGGDEKKGEGKDGGENGEEGEEGEEVNDTTTKLGGDHDDPKEGDLVEHVLPLQPKEGKSKKASKLVKGDVVVAMALYRKLVPLGFVEGEDDGDGEDDGSDESRAKALQLKRQKLQAAVDPTLGERNFALFLDTKVRFLALKFGEAGGYIFDRVKSHQAHLVGLAKECKTDTTAERAMYLARHCVELNHISTEMDFIYSINALLHRRCHLAHISFEPDLRLLYDRNLQTSRMCLYVRGRFDSGTSKYDWFWSPLEFRCRWQVLQTTLSR